MTRRDAMLGAGTLAGGIGLAQAQVFVNPAIQTTREASARRSNLIVKELSEEELDEIERLDKVANEAALAAHEYLVKLRQKYGEEPGVNVHFDSGYVFIRDYRDEMIAKEAALISQAIAQGTTGSNSIR